MIKIKFDREEMRSIAYDTDTTKEIGECCFIETKNIWDITHTWVYQDYQGQGIAKKLVQTVINAAKIDNKQLTTSCSYAQKILNCIK